MSAERDAELAGLRKKVESARSQGPAAEGRAWTELARACAAWEDEAEARQALAEAEARVRAAGEATDAAGRRAWLALRGAIALVHGRFAGARDAAGAASDAFEEAAKLAAEADDRGLRAEALLSCAAANARLGKILDGALQAEEAEDLFVETGGRTGDVAARAVADRLEAMIMESDELSSAADEDLALERKEGKDPRRLGWRLRMNAGCFMAGDEDGLEDALTLLEDAGKAFRTAESRPGEARAIRSQGACLVAMREPREAADAFLEAAAIYAEIGAALPQARTMLEAGHASRAGDDAARARECYEGAARIFGEREAWFEQGFVTEVLGDLFREGRDAPGAVSLFRQALALYDRAGGDLDDQRAGCLMSLGMACSAAGESAEAETRMAEARALFEKAGASDMVAACDRELKKLQKKRK
ncbi:MAG: tetratricopeptide repeat protein [Planctomycetia bacterium]|nr:tetratricopeptide repeat protein [Planctomycetia bacterium]